ncbi:MAG: HAD family hydrolase [Eubacteriales bacterium]|nr:HAD family hydrolase [Eubacteriales bacterium]
MQYADVALFSDMDGTLLNSGGTVSNENRDAINRFVANGGLFGISTGRATFNALKYLAGVVINCPSVVFNGAAVYDYTQSRYVFTNYVEQAAVLTAYEWRKQHLPRVDMQVYTDDEIYYVTPKETADPGFLKIHLPCQFRDIVDITQIPWMKSVLFGRGDDMRQLEAYVRQWEFADKIDLVHSTTDIVEDAFYLELMPKNVNKGSALNTLRGHNALCGRTFAAVGDYYNDLEMLQEADVTFVPSNGAPELRDMATAVVPSNNEHALAYIINELLPKL